MIKRKKIFFLIIIFKSNFLFAEEFTFKSIGSELASPITTDAKYVLLAGTLTSVGFALVKNEFGGDEAQSEASEHRPMGEASRFFDLMGQLVPNAIYAGAMYWNYKSTGSERSYNRSSAMFKASIYSSSVTTLLKYSVREKRPSGKSRNSFPSGHATTAFAFASVVGVEHGLAWGIPAYAIAGGVAYSRLNDNMHYTHDVLAGATIGIAYGIGLALHEEGIKKIKFMPLLTPADDGTGAKITWIKSY